MTLSSKTTHTNITKYSRCFKIHKCNNYEYNKHNLISMSGHRFTTQQCSIVNINARPKKKLQFNTNNRIPDIYLETVECIIKH